MLVKEFNNIREIIANTVNEHPDNNAFIIKNKDMKTYTNITYKRLQDEINWLGTALLKLDLKGKRVAVIGKNRYEWSVGYYAVVNGLGTVVPLDKGLPKEEIELSLKRINSPNFDLNIIYNTPVITINGNAEYSVTVTVIKPNKRSEKLLVDNNYAFTTTDSGVYTIKVVVEDIYKNKTTVNKTFTVAEPKQEGCAGALATSLFGLTILASAIFVLKKKKD